jgi:hypothetical protein
MLLREWEKTTDKTRAEIVKSLGVTYWTFTRWVMGRHIPTKRHAQKIRAMTRGKVTLADLYEAHDEFRQMTKERDHA